MKTSVALCTFNGEKYLKIQLDSILNQSQSVDEIVVCDDGSTDLTLKILEEYREKYPHIFKIYKNEKNLRSVKNFEKAISLCCNEIIFLSDQDDVWMEEKVKTFLKFFTKNPKISVLCSNGFAIDESGNTLDVLTIWDVPRMMKEKGIHFDYFQTISLVGNFATGATMAVRKDFLNEIIPFPEIKDFHHDEWIALISSQQGKFEILADKLIQYRSHSVQQVGGVFYENNEKDQQDLINFFNLDNSQKKFKIYKKNLKILLHSHLKFKTLQKHSEKHTFFTNYLAEIEDKYWTVKKDMQRKFPLQTFLLVVSDKILGKRQVHFKSKKNS